MSKSTIIGATPEQVNENTFGRLYKVSQNSTGGIDCDMYCFIKDVEQKDQQIADLEAKLAESEKRLVNCVDFNTWQKTAKENNELKKQLAEKDEEIEYLTKQVKKFNNEAQKYFEDAYCNDTIYQDKISFAVEQLEKVKEKINDCPITDYDTNKHFVKMYQRDAIRQLDNQIKQLKEMK